MEKNSQTFPNMDYGCVTARTVEIFSIYGNILNIRSRSL